MRARQMKIDGGIGFDLHGVAAQAAKAEADGYDGVWSRRDLRTIRSSPSPSPPSATETLEFGTGIAVAFARNPMTLAVLANDLQLPPRAASSSAWAARSSRTSPSASPCRGRTRRRACAS